MTTATLHEAAKTGQTQVMAELITAGCDVNQLEDDYSDSFTALHLACAHPDKDTCLSMVEQLLQHGAEVNKQMESSKRTALIIAAETGHVDVVRYLCEHGADVNHVCDEEEYPYILYQAFKFVTYSEIDASEKVDPFYGNSALMQACREHYLDVVKELLKHGCDLTLVSKSLGNTALHIACFSHCRTVFEICRGRFPQAGHPGIVRLLLAQPNCGAIVNMCNAYKDNPLRWTIRGIVEISNWSLDVDAKVTATADVLEIIEILLKFGVSVTGTEERPLTQLLKAGQMMKDLDDAEHLDQMLCNCLMLLLSAGCPITQTDQQLMNSETLHSVLEPMGVLDYTTKKCGQPDSLKRLCKFLIRSLASKPLAESLTQTGLPQALQKYILLEIID